MQYKIKFAIGIEVAISRRLLVLGVTRGSCLYNLLLQMPNNALVSALA